LLGPDHRGLGAHAPPERGDAFEYARLLPVLRAAAFRWREPDAGAVVQVGAGRGEGGPEAAGEGVASDEPGNQPHRAGTAHHGALDAADVGHHGTVPDP